MRLGLDTCFAMVPPRWAGGPKGALRHEGFAYQPLAAGHGRPVLRITYGEIGWRMMAGFHRAAAELVRAGNPIIIDAMLLDARVRDDWLDVLAPWRPLLIGVFCAEKVLEQPEKVLEQRDLARGNRPRLARWSARQAHDGIRYDLTLDTTSASPVTAAAEIANALYHPVTHERVLPVTVRRAS